MWMRGRRARRAEAERPIRHSPAVPSREVRVATPVDHPQPGLLAMIDGRLVRYRSGGATVSAAEVVDMLLDLRSTIAYDTELARLVAELEFH